ncbi:glycosyl hydrolase family 65 protein [Actinoallomurus bryophytorum]|uniref:Alpha,alpha-trehalose phosphorylase n=1 Tax=Actinoallomurus bryophytorum TaxID=1490222 RepID=A0A543CDT7_9ACTN|nr:glycoside hydrolase family 65 protein [Actinoallomurus bryophytorum]TQL95254.1 alpha,alpha-trehalose phosphorylase [Actinoallomurus bryophytorum]
MIKQAAYAVEPWCVREQRLDLDTLAQSESVFALSNGHIGLRGNLDEGEPHGLPGTYLNSVYELRALPYAEAGYGYPESGQTIINITNGKLIRLLVNDEPFDVRYGEVGSHERLLDLRAGTLSRKAEWTSPAGDTVRVSSVRLVSLVQRSVAAICYEVEAVNEPVRIVVQSELVANESLPDTVKDPRAAAVVDCPLVGEECVAGEQSVVMVHRTRESGLRVAAAMGHEIESPDGKIETDVSDDVGRLTVATHLKPGERLRIVKYLAYGWSSQRSRPALHDQVIAAMAAAKLSGWDGLLSEQRKYLDDFWAGADVEVDGDPEVQQAVRFGLFHVLQAGARGERRPISAKGLTGPGYDGHTFWDTESFVLPVLTFTQPRVVADALRWRHSTLDAAKARAEQLGLAGAAFPWRTISGDECSGYWPAGTAAFHIGADIAHAVVRYLYATEDEDFARDYGLELLVQTARLWRSLGHHDAQGRFRIDGVTGPDEYSAIADDNVYTNLMAQQNLRAAADLAERHPEQAEHLGVTDEETASWRDAAADMYIPFDERLQVHPQSEGFTDHAPWDFESTEADQYPLLLHFPYFDIYRKQVVKQADLVLAMHLLGEAFTPEQKARNFAYYEALTVRDSSLSASTQAVIAAETGHLDLAHDYLGEAALMDLGDLEHNTRDGLHIASLAGAWTALVAGLGGMRMPEGRLEFTPRLPGGITRLVFRMRFRGRRLKIHITAHEVVYELLEGEPLEIFHNGKPLVLNGGAVTRKVSAPPRRPAPTQPRGRAPRRRVE